MSKNTPAPSFSDIFTSLKGAVDAGRKRASDIETQIEKIRADADTQIAKLRSEHEKVLADNARAESGLAAMEGSSGKSKPGPKPAAKKAAAKKTAPKVTAKKAAASAPTATPKVKAKPGPKPGLKKTTPKAVAAKAPKAKATATAKKASTPKATAKKASASTAAANTSNAAEGRRAVARGDRPTMKEAMAIVIGTAKCTSEDVVKGLEKKGWLPNAENPQQYVSYMLSSNKDTFERVERGIYKVREGVTFTKKAKKAEAAAPAAKKTAPAAAAAPAAKATAPAGNGKKSTDDELGDLGIKTGGNVASNPFANA